MNHDTEEVLREEFKIWETAGESRASMKEVADYWIARFAEYKKALVDRLPEAFALEIENRDGTKDRFCSEAKIIQIIQEDK